MVNLNVIAPGTYFMDGAYGISEATVPMPLQARLKVELMPNVLEIEGTWQQHSGRPTQAFKLQIVRDHTSQSQADVTVAGTFIHLMKGRAAIWQPTYEVLATDESREQILSVHFTPADERGSFEVHGFVSTGPTGYFSFRGRVVPTDSRSALSNVVSLSGRAA